MNNFSCIITAGGIGSRFDKEKKKQFVEINGKPLINLSIEIFYEINEINEIIITLPADEYETASEILLKTYPQKIRCIKGGETRQKSVYNALHSCNLQNKFVLIHDAVRPFFDKNDLLAMMEIVQDCGALIPGSKIKHTIKKIAPLTKGMDTQSAPPMNYEWGGKGGELIEATIPRDFMIEVYTPQIFQLDKIKNYHQKAKDVDFTFSDDASIFEYFGEKVYWYNTEKNNLKITTKEDLVYTDFLMKCQSEIDATKKCQSEIDTTKKCQSEIDATIRIGYGYDVHQLVEGRKLILGGVEIPFYKGLFGHSDADVLLHAIIDALLGALALGDIGSNFPDTKKEYKDIDSRILLRETYQKINQSGWVLGNLDATICAQNPKLRPYIEDMRKNITDDLQCSLDCVSLKATTEENLGISGSEKGMTATSVVMLRR